jgi:hypothetical protein
MSGKSVTGYAGRGLQGKIVSPVVRISFLIAIFFVFCVSDTYAHEIRPGEYRVKAVFLYNFLQFIEWPANNNPGLTICILGDDPFGNDIDGILNETVNKRKLSVKYIPSDYSELKKCNLVFISHSEKDHLSEILQETREYPIVTISDTVGFAERGVMINFYLQENKIRFEINKDTASRSGIRISSKLLNLAKIVGNGQKR